MNAACPGQRPTRPAWLIVGVITCEAASVLITYFITWISSWEFYHATWTRNAMFAPPVIVLGFKAICPWLFLLPLFGFVIGIWVLVGRQPSAAKMACVGVLSLFHVIIIIAFLAALYFANQNFWA